MLGAGAPSDGWTFGTALGRGDGLHIVRFNRASLIGGEIEQIELRDAVLRQPQRLPRAEHEALDTDGIEQRREVVLGWAPDPTDVPPDAARLLRRRAEMDFLDERAISMGHDEPHVGVGADQGAHRGSRELGDAVVGMALPAVFESHREHQRNACRTARGGEHAHFATRRVETQIQWIAAHRRRAGVRGVGQYLLPLRQSRMDRLHRPEALLRARGLIQPRLAFRRVAPEETGQVRDPRDIDLRAIERAHERLRPRAGDLAPRVRTQERVAVDSHQSEGKARGGKMRAAFFQRMAAISSLASRVSRYRSFAHPVSIVMSLPHSSRLTPALSTHASSMPPSTPLPERST